jgi:peptide methionine sulfoxide reductase msrA/msrB
VSEVEPLRNYYPAEKYHQHYHEKNPSGYRHIEKEAFTYAGQYKG